MGVEMSSKDRKQDVTDGVTEKNTNIDESKRKFSKAGLAAPVIMTLASKPVFAAQGLSNMISGNTSVCRGDNYFGGFTQAYWADAASSQVSWYIATGTGPSGIAYQSITLAQIFGAAGLNYPIGTVGTDTLFSAVSSSPIVAGYLNLLFYQNNAGTDEYFLTPSQFLELSNGLIAVPAPYSSFEDLIVANMGSLPGDVCP